MNDGLLANASSVGSGAAPPLVADDCELPLGERIVVCDTTGGIGVVKTADVVGRAEDSELEGTRADERELDALDDVAGDEPVELGIGAVTGPLSGRNGILRVIPVLAVH